MNDEWEIRNLYGRYAELLNLCKIDEVAELFKYGKITSSASTNEKVGSEEVAEMYRSSVHVPENPPDTLLFTSNIQIEVDGDSAKGKAYFVAIFKGSKGLQPVIAGRYHDEFTRIDGKWWFAHRHMYSDLMGDLSEHLTQSIEDAAASGS